MPSIITVLLLIPHNLSPIQLLWRCTNVLTQTQQTRQAHSSHMSTFQLELAINLVLSLSFPKYCQGTQYNPC